MGVTLARGLIGGIGVVLIVSAIWVAALEGPGGELFSALFLFVPGVLMVAAVILERTRYRSLHAEQMARLVERGVTGLGLDEVGPGDAPGLTGVLPVGDERVQDRAGATRGHQSRGLGVGHRLGVHQVEGHRDDLALELGLARAHVALEGVDVGEHAERLAEELVVLVVAAVHRPGDLAGLPERVLLGRHRLHLGQHLGARPPARGERPVDGVPVGVREVVHGPDATANSRRPD